MTTPFPANKLPAQLVVTPVNIRGFRLNRRIVSGKCILKQAPAICRKLTYHHQPSQRWTMTQPHLPILYRFRRCPYAIRARMVLRMCRQDVELRNVLLANKPQELLEASAKATAPVLCLPEGNILDESLDIMQWAIDFSNDPEKLFCSDSEQQSQIELITYNDTEFKHWLDRYKYHNRHPEFPLEYYRLKIEKFLGILKARIVKSAFLFGSEPRLADVAIMPFIRQLAGVDTKWLGNSRYVALKDWLATWFDNPIFNNAMVKCPIWSIDQPATAFAVEN